VICRSPRQVGIGLTRSGMAARMRVRWVRSRVQTVIFSELLLLQGERGSLPALVFHQQHGDIVRLLRPIGKGQDLFHQVLTQSFQ